MNDATQKIRILAAVGRQTGDLKTRHAVGMPGGPQVDLPFPQLLVIESATDGIFLYRYTAGGDACGDTWHQSIEDAREQASFEYQDSLGSWYDVPASVDDPVAYAHSVGLISRP